MRFLIVFVVLLIISVGTIGLYVSATSTNTNTTTTTVNQDPIAVNNTFYNQYDNTILQATYGTIVDPMFIKADIMVESTFNSNAISWNWNCNANDIGLLQIDPICNQVNGNLYNATYNIYSAVSIYSNLYNTLQQKYPGCTTEQYWEMAAGDYNTGFGVNGCFPWQWTPTAQNYVDKLLTHYYQFQYEADYYPGVF